MSALDTALDLAARHGLAVFPLGADKRPVCAHGFLDASTDEATIRVLFATDAAVLVGVATGAINGFDVLDVDRHKEAGEAWIKENAHRIPVTARIQKTRRGGWHCFFRHHPGLRSSTDCPAKGVDIRGDGGYVVWWEGQLGCELISGGEPAGCEWPEELLQKVLARRSYHGTSQRRRRACKTESCQPLSAGSDALFRAQRGQPPTIPWPWMFTPGSPTACTP